MLQNEVRFAMCVDDLERVTTVVGRRAAGSVNEGNACMVGEWWRRACSMRPEVRRSRKRWRNERAEQKGCLRQAICLCCRVMLLAR